MLYRPEAFEGLTETPWDDGRVRATIRAIVKDVDDAWRGPSLMWRADSWDRWHATSPMKSLYTGAAGVVWALDELRRRGHAETRLDLAAVAERALALFRARPDLLKGMPLPSPPEAALLMGETGILLVAWRVAPRGEFADDLYALVRANVNNEADELMWGAPGTMIAAASMLAWTGEERWRDAWKESADALLGRRRDDGLWTKRLYGSMSVGLSPPHGLVGNVQALLPLLDDRRRDTLVRDTRAVLARTAVHEGAFANWPARDVPDLPGPDGQIRVQWCAGAPGIVIAAGDYLDEELLLAGAELVWQAGPPTLEKGASICHGTAGNGYAFLKAFARTGDERWLTRARDFAVHALEQIERQRTTRGRGRYSLWTGDLGAAVYAADCLDATAQYPVLG